MAVAFVLTFFGGIMIGMFVHYKIYPFGESSVGEEAKNWRDKYRATKKKLDIITKAVNTEVV